jgi:hypothetical protein
LSTLYVAKSENSINNSAVEELPEESIAEVCSQIQENLEPEKSQPPASTSTVSTPSVPVPLFEQPEFSETIDSGDFRFVMNLSKISERTEVNDSLSRSEFDKTTSNTFRPDPISSLSKKPYQDESGDRDQGLKLASIYRSRDQSTPKRSVLSFIFGCIFPFCHFG